MYACTHASSQKQVRLKISSTACMQTTNATLSQDADLPSRGIRSPSGSANLPESFKQRQSQPRGLPSSTHPSLSKLALTVTSLHLPHCSHGFTITALDRAIETTQPGSVVPGASNFFPWVFVKVDLDAGGSRPKRLPYCRQLFPAITWTVVFALVLGPFNLEHCTPRTLMLPCRDAGSAGPPEP
eukprot:scaffold288131_cov21-Tisochrysis_lutea.AAC.1